MKATMWWAVASFRGAFSGNRIGFHRGGAETRSCLTFINKKTPRLCASAVHVLRCFSNLTMAKILLIETASEVCSAAIAADGNLVAIAEDQDQPNHAARLTLLIQECVRHSGIALAELDAVAVSRGPGSYTSLRVGASVAKGICYALDKPLIAVDTLQALAAASRRAFEPHRSPGVVPLFVPMLDARRKEVWTAVYDDQLQKLVDAQPLILDNNLFEIFLQFIPGFASHNVFVISGNGVKKIPNELISENVVASPVQNCSAAHLGILAEQIFQNADFQDIAYFEPFYMKPPNITTPGKNIFS